MSSTWCYDLGKVSRLYDTAARHNNGMHPTTDTLLLIFGNLAGRRVMPGVRCFPLMGHKYYILWYSLDGSDSYLIWYSDEQDGVLTDEEGCVPSFGDRGSLLSYAERQGVNIEAEKPVLHNLEELEEW